MKEYVIILRGSVTMADWRCKTFHTSDEFAVEYWKRRLSVDPVARHAMSATLFLGKSWKIIAEYTLKEVIKVTVT